MRRGFTLAELLIALAILGVIATFTIPKVLQAQADRSSNAKAKEAIGAVSAAYQSYKLNNAVDGNFYGRSLTAAMNFIRTEPLGYNIDDQNGNTTYGCGTGNCILMANGAVIAFSSEYFSGTGTTNVITFYVDPDGVNGGSTTGPSKSVKVFLYYDGRITSSENRLPASVSNNGAYSNTCSGCDPDWFSWE